MKLNRLIPFLAILGLSASILALPSEPGKTTETFEFAGESRTYGLRLPSAIKSKKKLPLILLVHGFTGSGTLFETYSGFVPIAEKEGAILLSPDGVGRPAGWNCGFVNLGRAGIDDIGFLGALLDKVVKDLPVNRNMVFVAGHSNGAMMANALAASRPDLIASIGAMAGLVGVGRTEKQFLAKPKGKVSILHIHGTADNVVGYDDRAQAMLVGVSATNAILWWAEQMGLKTKPETEKREGIDILRVTDKRHTAELWSLKDWRHDWPLGPRAPIATAQVMWDFFVKHPKR